MSALLSLKKCLNVGSASKLICCQNLRNLSLTQVVANVNSEFEVNISNIPFYCTENDVSQFFFPIQVSSVQLEGRTDGTKRSARVSFHSSEALNNALAKHMGQFNGNVVTIRRSATKRGDNVPPYGRPNLNAYSQDARSNTFAAASPFDSSPSGGRTAAAGSGFNAGQQYERDHFVPAYNSMQRTTEMTDQLYQQSSAEFSQPQSQQQGRDTSATNGSPPPNGPPRQQVRPPGQQQAPNQYGPPASRNQYYGPPHDGGVPPASQHGYTPPYPQYGGPPPHQNFFGDPSQFSGSPRYGGDQFSGGPRFPTPPQGSYYPSPYNYYQQQPPFFGIPRPFRPRMPRFPPPPPYYRYPGQYPAPPGPGASGEGFPGQQFQPTPVSPTGFNPNQQSQPSYSSSPPQQYQPRPPYQPQPYYPPPPSPYYQGPPPFQPQPEPYQHQGPPQPQEQFSSQDSCSLPGGPVGVQPDPFVSRDVSRHSRDPQQQQFNLARSTSHQWQQQQHQPRQTQWRSRSASPQQRQQRGQLPFQYSSPAAGGMGQQQQTRDGGYNEPFEVRWYRIRSSINWNSPPTHYIPESSQFSIQMRNLVKDVTVNQLTEFLSPLVPNKIVMGKERGLTTSANVEFATEGDAYLSLLKDGFHFRGRSCMIHRNYYPKKDGHVIILNSIPNWVTKQAILEGLSAVGSPKPLDVMFEQLDAERGNRAIIEYESEEACRSLIEAAPHISIDTLKRLPQYIHLTPGCDMGQNNLQALSDMKDYDAADDVELDDNDVAEKLESRVEDDVAELAREDVKDPETEKIHDYDEAVADVAEADVEALEEVVDDVADVDVEALDDVAVSSESDEDILGMSSSEDASDGEERLAELDSLSSDDTSNISSGDVAVADDNAEEIDDVAVADDSAEYIDDTAEVKAQLDTEDLSNGALNIDEGSSSVANEGDKTA